MEQTRPNDRRQSEERHMSFSREIRRKADGRPLNDIEALKELDIAKLNQLDEIMELIIQLHVEVRNMRAQLTAVAAGKCE